MQKQQWQCALLVALAVVLFVGCQEQKGKPTGQKSDPSRPMSEGDKAWQEVLNAMKDPEPPASWQNEVPSREELEAFEKQTGKLALEVAVKARDFYTRFPQHEKAGEAREQEYQLLSLSAQLGDTNSSALVEALEAARLKDPNTSADDRFDIRIQQLQRQVMANDGTNLGPSVEHLEKGARELRKEFPNRPETDALFISAAQGYLDEGNIEKAQALMTELKDSQAPEVKQAVEQLTEKIERVGKPLELKFTAMDGRQIDLQTMTNKVVLIDFWATWCKPCLAELPKVKEAYAKLQPKGFEIVGISLDTDKEDLDKLISKEQMTWPQFFGENDGGSEMADQYGISGIPAMWLVDKKGVLRDLNARHDLAGKVEKLLAE